MAHWSFHAESVPNELALSGGYSSFYVTERPKVAVVGDWQKRYCSLFDTFKPVLNPVHNFEVRHDDVWIVTNPKSGTTWTQEMTWLILNDYDFERAKAIDLYIRSPFLEVNGVVPNRPDKIEEATKMASPRLIKSHLPAFLLPEQLWSKRPKIIYVFRDPRDAAISYFHHSHGINYYKGTKEDFMQSYINGYVRFNPFWPHVLDFWQMRNEANVFFTSYERMKNDLDAVIRDVCRFLHKDLSDGQLRQMVEHLSFDKMKENPACDIFKEIGKVECGFIRRGIVGSHKDELPQAIIHDFDDWTENNLRDYNLSVDDFVKYSKY